MEVRFPNSYEYKTSSPRNAKLLSVKKSGVRHGKRSGSLGDLF
jgi:hypothetical protein